MLVHDGAETLQKVKPQVLHVSALLADGSPKANWHGALLLRDENDYVITTRWTRRQVASGPLTFYPGDIVVEFFSASEWFNVFAVWAGDGSGQRGWYVNLAQPFNVKTGGARSSTVHGQYVDLALDFVVTRDQAVELDTAAWNEIQGTLPDPVRAAATAAAGKLRQNLLGVEPAAAWQFLEGLMARPARNGHQGRLPRLAGLYGPPVTVSLDLDWRGSDLGRWIYLHRGGHREAEAIYVLRLPRGQVLLHTKLDYPPGTWRLPGGGVPRGESPDLGAAREALEETSLFSRPVAFLGYADLRLHHDNGVLAMPNYVFLLEPDDPLAKPVPSGDEGITQLLQVSWRELPEIAGKLAAMTGPWKAWGLYRAIPHMLAYEAIASSYQW